MYRADAAEKRELEEVLAKTPADSAHLQRLFDQIFVNGTKVAELNRLRADEYRRLLTPVQMGKLVLSQAKYSGRDRK